jgi:signal transduction histidine kinase
VPGSFGAELPGFALGLRLMALAVISAACAFLPAGPRELASLIAGVACGALLGFLRYANARNRRAVPGEFFVLSQVAVWTWLVSVSGGATSPLFFGYLLEVPLAGALLARRGALLAAAAGAAAYVGLSAILDPPIEVARCATGIGFLALTALLTWLVIGVLERQGRQIAASQAILSARAENLAEELRLLGDYLNVSLIGLDDLGRVASVNQAGLALVGAQAADVMGRPWQEVMQPDAAGNRAILRTLAEGCGQRGLRMTLAPAGAEPVSVEAELWVAPTPEGRRTFVLLDPGRREGEEESDPLRRLGEAAAIVSHQIRNSLHALQGFAGAIERELGPARSDHAAQLLRVLASLGELSEDVLAMAGSAEAGDQSVPLCETLSSAAALARRPGARLELDLPGQPVYVRGHRGRLVHAFFNLLDNACRLSPAGRAVEVRARADRDRVVVEIRDAGPGLPAGLAGRARPPSRDGHGYGLVAARRFLEASGGALTFDPLPEGGTLARVSLRSTPHP